MCRPRMKKVSGDGSGGQGDEMVLARTSISAGERRTGKGEGGSRAKSIKKSFFEKEIPL